MKKPIVRQLKKNKVGNELVVCVAPENREKLGANEGDNLMQRYNPDSGVVEISKVVQSPEQQQDETRENTEDETRENKSRVDLADEKEQSQADGVSKIAHCTSCGSDDIQVTGNQFYCGDCDVTYEVTPTGTKVVATNPMQIIDDLDARVEQLEQDVDKLNGNSDKDEVDFLDEDEDKPWGFIGEIVGAVFGTGGTEDDEDEDLVPVGAGSDEDEDEDEETELGGFITW